MNDKLIIFDIDGTLTNTNESDALCFEMAIKDRLNLAFIDTNWHNYKYSTEKQVKYLLNGQLII